MPTVISIYFSPKNEAADEMKFSHRVRGNKRYSLIKTADLPASVCSASAVIKTLWCHEASIWTHAEQTDKSEPAGDGKVPTTRLHHQVAWSVKQTPVTRCYGDGNEAPVPMALLTNTCFKTHFSFPVSFSAFLHFQSLSIFQYASDGEWSVEVADESAEWSGCQCEWLSISLLWRLIDWVGSGPFVDRLPTGSWKEKKKERKK